MTYDDSDNDGRFPDDSRVEVRYPRSRKEEHGDRAAWPWLPGSIVEQCGPDEWRVCVEDRGVAVLRDGRPAPRNTAPGTSTTRCASGIPPRSAGPRRRCAGPACRRCACPPWPGW
jgi:hypothetical protein